MFQFRGYLDYNLTFNYYIFVKHTFKRKSIKYIRNNILRFMHFLINIIMMEQGGKRKNLRRFIYCKNIIKVKNFNQVFPLYKLFLS